jgi:hypothetical protein
MLDDHWRVKIRFNGKVYSRNFAYLKHGGISESFKIALRYIDELLRMRRGLDDSVNRIIACLGITLEFKIIKDSLEVYWIVSGFLGNSKITRPYSIGKYGYKQAFIEACKIRYGLNGTIIILNKDEIPCLPTVPYKYHQTDV